jgi:beta-lactamase regulating signal transducer with metallopeptidase domain
MSNDVLFFANWLLGSSFFVKTWIVSAVAIVSEILARKRSAAVRHIALAMAFGMLLGLPVAANLLPAIRIVFPIKASNNTVSQSKDWQPWTVSALEPDGSIDRSTSTIAKTQANLWESRLLPAAWLTVFLLLLIPISSGLWRLRRLRQSAIQWTRGQSLVDSIAAKEGINRHVALVLQPKVSGPMTCGALRPMIFFPEDATAWPKEDLQRALVHELEHVKRGDWAIQCLARIICAGYWFNPFVWVAWRRLVLQAERACDDAVLHDGDAIAYADQLIDTAQRVSMISKQALPAMANRSELAARVHAVLDPQQRRGPVGRRFLLAAFSIAAVLVFVLSTFKIDTTAQSAEPQWQKAAGGKMAFEVSSIKEGRGEGPGGGANFPLDAGDSFSKTGGYFKGNFPAFVYIAFAYKLNPPGPEQKNIMLDGVPGWVTTRRFTIEA